MPASLCTHPRIARYAPNRVVNSCKNGEIRIIRTIQPMKLARGSYRIIGTPKLAISRVGSNRIEMVGIQITIIQNRVTAEESKPYISVFRNTRGTAVVVTVIYLTINQPTRKPNRMQKIGTPMPMATHMVSNQA